MLRSPVVMLIEDEMELAMVVQEYLQHAGMTVELLHSGVNAVERVRSVNPDLLIIDVMLPGMDGLEICRQVRASSDMPIILETARTEEVDRIIGLEIGADDYICKPFSPRELTARVKANLRRIGFYRNSESVSRLSLDEHHWVATIDNMDLKLTRREFQLLKELRASQGRVLSRDQLIDRVFGLNVQVTDRTIDSHIRNIRMKVKSIAPDIEPIRSVYGVGYAADSDE